MEMEDIIKSQRHFFAAGNTLSIGFREKQLRTLAEALDKYEQSLTEALASDLGKSACESYLTEIGTVRMEITEAIKRLPRWAKPEKARCGLAQFPATGKKVWEPLGCVLIMSPWNYPLQLTLAPLVGAIAAGDCAVVKPSRYAERTAVVMQRMLEEYFPQEYIAVFQGGAAVNTELLTHKFDLIFFTGSPSVGKVVMEAAAKHLCPVVLELGGKSPCIVDETADIRLTARRLIWGKCINAGQTCVAPDYVACRSQVKDELLICLREELEKLYGDDFLDNPEYCRIINKRHFDRLLRLMGSGDIVFGGRYREEALKIEPTILDNVTTKDPVMKEEIFGPLLPVLTWDTEEQLKKLITSHGKPLACYIFTKDKRFADRLIEGFSFGGGCVNDVIMHLTSSELPFGGVGGSGMGSYHGEKSFQTFSHQKSVLNRRLWPDVSLRYPPYGEKLGLIKKIMK